MPLQICEKCHRFHYVPGDCPPPKAPLTWAFYLGEETKAISERQGIKDKRKGDRHKPGYQAAKQREYRARKRAEKG